MAKRVVALAAALLLAAGMGWAGAARQAAEPLPSVLNLSMYAAPRGVFNPILAEDGYDAQVLGLIFHGLLDLNERFEWVCDLCLSYSFSADQRTITFRLREDVAWHDGHPFTAEDVAYTIRAILHPDYPGVRTGDFAALAGVERMLSFRERLAREGLAPDEVRRRKLENWEAWLRGDGARAIRVVDPHTIAFTTDYPYAPLLQSLAVWILPAHIYGDTPVARMAEHPAVRHPVGTGPYKFVRYLPDQYVELVRNEAYFRGAPQIERVIYRIANQDVALGQLMAGELDVVVVNPADLELLKSDPDIAIFPMPDFAYQYLGLNHDHPALGDRRVRQAIMHAINRQGIVDRLLRGHGTVMNTHIHPGSWAYDADGLDRYPYDPDRAAQLLAEAGWRERGPDGYLVKDGKTLSFTLKYASGNRVREATAPLIQADLKAVGIKVELQMLEFATLMQQVFGQRAADAWLMGWGVGSDPHPGAIFLPDNKWGRVTGWRSPRSEALIRQGSRLLSQAERKPVYREWARLLNEELPYIFLYSQHQLVAVRTDRVRGWAPNVRGVLWNIHELRIEAR